MRSIIVALAVLCGTGTVSAQNRTVDEVAIPAHAVAIETAINQRDPAALVALFTPDGDEINGEGPHVSSRDAMRRTQEAAMPTWSPTMRFTLAVTDIRFLGQDTAMVETVARFNEGVILAIWEAGNDAGCSKEDQIGQRRRRQCDIGAIEFRPQSH